VTPTQVLALRPAAGGYRLAWARERPQDASWPIPALFLAAGREEDPELARPDAMGPA
jgi:hypothetical protein